MLLLLIVRMPQVNKYYYFLMFISILFLTSYVNNKVLLTEDLFFDFYGEQIAYERIVEMIEKSNEWQWVIYPLMPLYYLIKFFIVAGCLYVGVLLIGNSLNFTKVFHVAMLSESIFLLVPIIKIVWFGVFFTDYTLQDLQYFSPLSLFGLFDGNSLEPWVPYPLQLVNVFELAYWLLLAYGLYSLTNERYSKMLSLVASSYGAGLLLWVVFVVFLTVSIAP